MFHFALTDFLEDDSSARALAEALWCSCLGTYELNGEWLALRRLYGLPNPGEAVKGGNGEFTRASKRPRACVVRVFLPHPVAVPLYLPVYCSNPLCRQASEFRIERPRRRRGRVIIDVRHSGLQVDSIQMYAGAARREGLHAEGRRE